jgi:hypothetical protein
VTTFGPLTCSIVTTTRKFFTILVSVLFYGNSLVSRQWLGVVFVFLGLGLDSMFGKTRKWLNCNCYWIRPDVCFFMGPCFASLFGRVRHALATSGNHVTLSTTMGYLWNIFWFQKTTTTTVIFVHFCHHRTSSVTSSLVYNLHDKITNVSHSAIQNAWYCSFSQYCTVYLTANSVLIWILCGKIPNYIVQYIY